MENIRKFLKSITKKCCFDSEYTISESIEAHEKNRLDITNIKLSRPEIYEKGTLMLKLTVAESEKMQEGKFYSITPFGLVDSARTKSGDGCVYAGCLYYENDRIINDILLPSNEKGIGSKHFVIEYIREKNRYFIKDLGEGMGTFIRLNRSLVLQNNYIVSFGDSHMIILIDNTTLPKLVLRFIDGPKVDQKL